MKNTLVFIIAIVLAELLGLTVEDRAALGIDLASIHVIDRSRGSWEPLCLNRTDHLDGVKSTDE